MLVGRAPHTSNRAGIVAALPGSLLDSRGSGFIPDDGNRPRRAAQASKGLRTNMIRPSLVAVFLWALAPMGTAAPIEPGAVEVIDGDTVRVRGSVVRLVGFDAPRSRSTAKSGNRPASSSASMTCANSASQARWCASASNSTVTLHARLSPTAARTPRRLYDRPDAETADRGRPDWAAPSASCAAHGSRAGSRRRDRPCGPRPAAPA